MLAVNAAGVEPLRFGPLQRLTNGETVLTLHTAAGVTCRVDVSSSLVEWTPLVSLVGGATVRHTDSGAPFVAQRFYRAVLTNVIPGDFLATTAGPAIIHPGNHAGFMMLWGNHAIYVDPVTNVYAGLPKATLILLTHDHADHLNNTTLSAVIDPVVGRIVAPQATYNNLSTALKGVAQVLTNGGVLQWSELTIEAVPMYNLSTSYHPRGRGNGYVVTLGGRRIYISGDTDNTPEVRALTNIDVAFVCMRPPYCMSVTDAAQAVRAFRPRVVYPYHYLGNDVNLFKQLVGTDLGIEVRLRSWY
jgi:L-ascorbate metabolism protein UlaG (beta-lactamase superfamily)